MQSVSIGQRTPEGTTPQSKKWPAERERGPRSGQPRAVLALFTQIRMLGQSKKKKSSHYKSFFSSGFCCWLFYRLTYATLNNSFRLLLFVRFPATCKLKSVDLHVYWVRIQGATDTNVEQIKAALRTAFFSPCSTLLLWQDARTPSGSLRRLVLLFSMQKSNMTLPAVTPAIANVYADCHSHYLVSRLFLHPQSSTSIVLTE